VAVPMVLSCHRLPQDVRSVEITALLKQNKDDGDIKRSKWTEFHNDEPQRIFDDDKFPFDLLPSDMIDAEFERLCDPLTLVSLSITAKRFSSISAAKYFVEEPGRSFANPRRFSPACHMLLTCLAGSYVKLFQALVKGFYLKLYLSRKEIMELSSKLIELRHWKLLDWFLDYKLKYDLCPEPSVLRSLGKLENVDMLELFFNKWYISSDYSRKFCYGAIEANNLAGIRWAKKRMSTAWEINPWNSISWNSFKRRIIKRALEYGNRL
jgi:hypothetical protein